MNFESTGSIVLIYFVLVLVIVFLLVGFILSSLTIYSFYRKPRKNKGIYVPFLVILALTEVVAFLFTFGLFMFTIKAEYILTSLHSQIVQMVVEKVVAGHSKLLELEWLWNDKMKNLFSPDIIEQIKINHLLNQNTLNLLVGINNIAIMMSILLFVAVNYLCISLFISLYRHYVIKKKITYV